MLVNQTKLKTQLNPLVFLQIRLESTERKTTFTFVRQLWDVLQQDGGDPWLWAGLIFHLGGHCQDTQSPHLRRTTATSCVETRIFSSWRWTWSAGTSRTCPPPARTSPSSLASSDWPPLKMRLSQQHLHNQLLLFASNPLFSQETPTTSSIYVQNQNHLRCPRCPPSWRSCSPMPRRPLSRLNLNVILWIRW